MANRKKNGMDRLKIQCFSHNSKHRAFEIKIFHSTNFFRSQPKLNKAFYEKTFFKVSSIK